MEQNNIWVRYLALGLFISLMMMGAACKKNTSWVAQGDFYFINETKYIISYLPDGYERFNIPPQSSIMIKDIQDNGEMVRPEYYHSPLFNKGTTGWVPIKDSFIIKFDNNKCWETLNSDHSPLDIKNYVAEKTGNRAYKFTYTFTEEDYNRATACP